MELSREGPGMAIVCTPRSSIKRSLHGPPSCRQCPRCWGEDGVLPQVTLSVIAWLTPPGKAPWLSSRKPCCRCPGTPVEARIPVSVSRPSGSSFLNLPTPHKRWGRAQAVTTLLGSCHLEAKYRGLFRPLATWGVFHRLRSVSGGVLLRPDALERGTCLLHLFMFTQHTSHRLDDIPAAWQSPVQSLLFLQNHLC